MTASSGAAGVRAWLDGLDQARAARAPRWWEHCGCHEATGEFPDASDCHQVGLCVMRQRHRQRDDDEAALTRIVRAVLDLADEWDRSHDWTDAAHRLRAAVTAAQEGAGQP